jgi:acetamidase/formamidase
MGVDSQVAEQANDLKELSGFISSEKTICYTMGHMIHRFKPTRYYNAIGTHEPALRVGDGDTIVTTTIDALGRDERDKYVWQRGNPMSGPFHVEGAQPGDTLVVKLEKITPNRRIGYARDVMAANVVDPDYVRELPASKWVKWDVDAQRKTAHIKQQGHELTVPLHPMIGCFGVAPSRGQAISTATSGDFGGNMDYNGFVAGVTVYFPVFVEGALFHLGDVHAVQGDGEIVGTGIEISAEVKFNLSVIKNQKGKEVRWPRGQTRDFIFTVGNARPLDQCIQHATTEMLRWLQSDYNLSARHASTLLGQCVKYDLGNVFDPAYTMVCKLAKKWLG